ncbi:MAG: hypothetical protein ABR613_08755 [Actinomycetota bacterium]
MATPPEIQETRGINNAQAGLAVAGVLVLLVVLWFVFLRGGDDPVEDAAPIAPPVSSPLTPQEPVEPPDDGKGPGKGPVETFQVFAPKDPFKPLISTDTGTGTTTPPGTDTGTGTDTDGDGVPDGGTVTGNGTGTGGGGGGENVAGHRVSLVDVFRGDGGEPRAQVQVDGTVYTVEEGEQFAERFQLLSINGDCATMLYGDDQFTLCEGEEILK